MTLNEGLPVTEMCKNLTRSAWINADNSKFHSSVLLARHSIKCLHTACQAPVLTAGKPAEGFFDILLRDGVVTDKRSIHSVLISFKMTIVTDIAFCHVRLNTHLPSIFG
jgi:hypothetical protein